MRDSPCSWLGAVGFLLLLATVAIPAAARQAPQGSASQSGESFEVASIRVVEQPRFRRALTAAFPGGRFEASNASVHDLIYYAYALQRPQTVEGGPSWARSDRFDVTAKAAQDFVPSPAETIGPIQRRLQRLLAERFNLAVHLEKRTQPARALVLARSDGRLGLQLRPSVVDCAALHAARVRRILTNESPQEPDNLESHPGGCNMITTNGRMQAAGHTMSEFAVDLSAKLRETVVNRTGLTGPFAIEMTAAPMFLPPELAGSAPDFGPPLDVALRDQLGLKLERTQLDVDVIIIDRVERPTEN